MPSHYTFVCEQGHETRRYRNAQRCKICGLPITRKQIELTPEQASTLRMAAKILCSIGQPKHGKMLNEIVDTADVWEAM